MSTLNRHKPLGRNSKRSRETRERNFGDRDDAVREMPCLAGAKASRALDTLRALGPAGPAHDVREFELMDMRCASPVQACHVLARGMGGVKGDRRDLVPLCARHHEESGEGSWKPQQPSKRAAFEKRYGLDLKDEAKRIADQLDERGLS